MSINKMRFHSTPVLPLVYDDALSYYEVLAKVVYKLNETIDTVNNINSDTILAFLESGGADEVLQDRIDALADDLASDVADNTEALNGTLLKNPRFYNVLNLDGVVADDETDCYLPIRQLMDTIWQSGKPAVVYFPSGTYKISVGTIPIPDNVTIFGDGATSIIHRTDIESITSSTGAFAPAGDNIVIYNLKISLEGDTIELQTGSLANGIGITNIAYPGLYPSFTITRVASRKNIICDHIYSDGIYPLQCEIASGTGVISNVTFKNGTYTRGIVSMYPWDGDGNGTPGLKNCRIENISCKWLRVGGRVSTNDNYCMYGEGIFITDCCAKYAWLMSDGILVNGLYIDASDNVTLDGTYLTAGLEICGNVAISNMQVVGGGSYRTTGIINHSLDSTFFSNVIVHGFALPYTTIMFNDESTPGDARSVNCDFTTTHSLYKGYTINSILGAISNLPVYDVSTLRYATMTAAEGVTFQNPGNTRINTVGIFAWSIFRVVSTNPWTPAYPIATMPANYNPIDVENRFSGVMMGVDQDNNIIFMDVNVTNQGVVQPWASAANVTAWSGTIILFYTLK